MNNTLLLAGTLLSALGCGLISGVFFAFSTFVMRALGRLPAPQSIAAMQSINLMAINPMFLGLFLGTAALCVFLVAASFWRWREPANAYVLAAAAFTMALRHPAAWVARG